MSAHAKLAPSASGRWIACPGSIALEAKCPELPDSEYAAEGTAAHKLAEQCLSAWQPAFTALGSEVNGYAVNDDMADAVQVYLDEVWAAVNRDEIARKQKQLFIEQSFNLAWIHPDIWGTSDAAVYDVAAKRLKVFDYKHGRGVVVEPAWNSQLMTYALGAMRAIWDSQTDVTKRVIDLFHMFDEIELVIIQPRAEHAAGYVRSWTISARDLVFWGMSVLKTAALRTEDNDAALVPGAHCRFCKAIAVCPAHAERACQIAKADFAKPLLPPPDQLSGDDLARVLNASKAFSNWAGQVKAYALAEMQRGRDIPGYKLVKRKSNRRWRQGSGYEDQLVLLLGDSAYKPREVLSVAQAEARCKAEGIAVKALADLWDKPDIGVAIAEVSDSRKAIVSSVESDFNDLSFLE